MEIQSHLLRLGAIYLQDLNNTQHQTGTNQASANICEMCEFIGLHHKSMGNGQFSR